MKDYCKNLESSLAPKRDLLVRSMANYLCATQAKFSQLGSNWRLYIQLCYGTKKCQHEITVRHNTRAETMFNWVDGHLPRRLTGQRFVLQQCALQVGRCELYMPDKFIGKKFNVPGIQASVRGT